MSEIQYMTRQRSFLPPKKNPPSLAKSPQTTCQNVLWSDETYSKRYNHSVTPKALFDTKIQHHQKDIICTVKHGGGSTMF